MSETIAAALHGAGFRLVFPQAALQGFSDTGKSVEAELFGPDGRMNAPDDAQQVGSLDRRRVPPDDEASFGTLGRLGLTLSATDLGAIEKLLSIQDSGTLSGVDRIGRLAVLPLRVYSTTAALSSLPDPAILDRLGRLGDAMLTDYGFAPPPPVPPPMSLTPAVYTYLGQFLAHELTLFRVDEAAAAAGLTQVIDSAIDLKTIFRRPEDFPKKPPVHVKESEGLALGQTLAPGGRRESRARAADVPRKPSGAALLYEMRNDQNLALSQIHVAITQFAQNAVKILRRNKNYSEEQRERIVLRHFQSVVLQDYLVRLVDPATWSDVMSRGRVVVAPNTGGSLPNLFFVPIQFSAAIFRFGHLMRRDSYEPWNALYPNHSVDSALASQLLGLTGAGGGLTNGQLLRNWTADWRFMLGQDGEGPIKAKKIGTRLSKSLFCLPEYLFAQSALDQPCGGMPAHLNLARRTLVGGGLIGLQSGQELAIEVEQPLRAASSPCSIPVLKPEQTEIPGNRRANDILREAAPGPRFVHATPLWLYILREAAVWGNGDRLGPLGGRYVAETINAAVEASGSGMIVGGVRRHFAPDPDFGGASNDKFDLQDLMRLAQSAVT